MIEDIVESLGDALSSAGYTPVYDKSFDDKGYSAKLPRSIINYLGTVEAEPNTSTSIFADEFQIFVQWESPAKPETIASFRSDCAKRRAVKQVITDWRFSAQNINGFAGFEYHLESVRAEVAQGKYVSSCIISAKIQYME